MLFDKNNIKIFTKGLNDVIINWYLYVFISVVLSNTTDYYFPTRSVLCMYVLVVNNITTADQNYNNTMKIMASRMELKITNMHYIFLRNGLTLKTD